MQSIKAAKGGQMSGNNSNVQFRPVDEPGGSANGPLVVIRGGRMLTFGVGDSSEQPLSNGTTIQGIYEGATPNKYNEEQLDFKIRSSDSTLYILAQTATLARQLSKVKEGELIEVTYNGRKSVKRKTGGMAEMHDFRVSRAIVDAE